MPEPVAVRAAVLDTAAAIIEAEGTGGLSTRRLAAQAGTSTMGIYTHFGSISAVIGAVIERGFTALTEHLAIPGTSEDPLADTFALALAYLDFARRQPQLYATMFQYTSDDWQPGRRRNPVTAESPTTSTAGTAAFATFAGTLERLAGDDREALAGTALLGAQCWSALHGVAMLRIAGHLGDDDVARSLLVALAVGNGFERGAAERSYAAADGRMAQTRAPERDSEPGHTTLPDSGGG